MFCINDNFNYDDIRKLKSQVILNSIEIQNPPYSLNQIYYIRDWKQI